MKEQIRMVADLTASTQRSYSRDGEIFMAENGEGQKPVNHRPEKLEENPRGGKSILKEVRKPLSPERQAVVDKMWDSWTKNYLKEQGRTSLTFGERQAIKTGKKFGTSPNVAGGVGESPSTESPDEQTPKPEEERGQQERRYQERMLELNQALAGIRQATLEGRPNLIEETIDKVFDLNDRDIPVERLAEISFSDDSIEHNLYGYAFEYLLEKILRISDYTPLSPIPQTSFTQVENVTRIIAAALAFDKDERKRFYSYLLELKEKRETSHELFRLMRYKGAYEKYVGEHLTNNGFDFLENEIVGVSDVQQAWEKVLADMNSSKGTYLDQEDFRNAYTEVSGLFRQAADLNNEGTSTKLTKEFKISINGGLRTIIRPVRRWEIDRALVVGRSVGSASGRLITYGVLGNLPENPDDLFKSLDTEYVARTIAGRKLIGQRFIAQGFSGSKKYMEIWIKNMKKIARSKGLFYGEGMMLDNPDMRERYSLLKEELDRNPKRLENLTEEEKDLIKKGDIGLYGNTVDAWTLLDSSVSDLKSHSWRSKKIFLMSEEYAKISEDGKTIGKYLDDAWMELDLDRESGAGIRGKIFKRWEVEWERIQNSLSNEERAYFKDKSLDLVADQERKKNIIFSRGVRDQVLRQRLYSGVLLRDGRFTPQLKTEVWKNVAGYLPSRIAAFFPRERRELGINDQEWGKLKNKLFIAEMDRVRKQARMVMENNFTEVALSDYYDQNGITNKEQAMIQSVIRFGEEKAEALAKIIFPFNAFLDDVPKTEWMKIGAEDIGRLIVDDYQGYTQANNEVSAIISEPTMRLAESAEHLVKAKRGYESPLGAEGAQSRLEADVLTRYELYGMDTSSKFGTYSIKKFLRKPTSLIEKYDVDANISMDEQAIAGDAEFLAQHAVIGNDTTKRDFLGLTQLERIKKKGKAALINVWLRHLRILAMLFPLAFAQEFLKMLGIGEFVKAR